MKKIIKVAVIFILFIGCSAQPKKSSMDISNSSKGKVEARKVVKNINSDFNKKLAKLGKLVKLPLLRNNSKKVVIDRNTNLMWQDNNNMPRKTWSGAKNHCNNLRFAGFSDWRLPNINELLSITDDTKYNPAINTSFKNYYSAYFWSSSINVSALRDAWFVNFKYGNDRNYGTKSTSYYVRCVRDSSL